MTKQLSGSAVILTLVAVVLLLTFVAGVVRIFPRDVLAARNASERKIAKQAAWSGIEHGLLLITSQRKEVQPASLSTGVDTTYHLSSSRLNCDVNPTDCLSFDRLLGKKKTATPISVSLDAQTSYALSLGNKTSQLGNPQEMSDGWGRGGEESAHWGIRNPIFRPDTTYTFNADGLSADIILHTAIPTREKCRDVTSAHVVSRWVDGSGKTLAETTGKINQGNDFSPIAIPYPRGSSKPVTLVVTFNMSKNVAGCFGRFALVPSQNDVIDFGFEVLESVGKRNNTTYTVRMLVGRQEGHILGIYEGNALN